MIDNLLDAIAEVIKDAQRSEKKGLYYFAGLKYAQAKGMLDSIVILHDQKAPGMRLSEKEEYRLSVLFELLATCFQSLQGKVGNGKHRMSGSSSRDTLKEALDHFLES